MGRPKKEKPNHGDYYEIKITIGRNLDGTAIRKSFYSTKSKEDARRQAEEWKINQQVAYMTDSMLDGNKTFAECASMWLEVKKRTVKSNTYEFSYKNTVENHLLPEFGKRCITTIQPYHIEKFLIKKAKDISASSLKKIKFCLSAIFEKAIQNRLCTSNPVLAVENIRTQKQPKEKRTYTEEQLKLVYAFAMRHRFGLGIILAAEYGLRRGELLALRWDSVDFDKGLIRVENAIAKNMNSGKLVMEINKPKTAYSIREMPLSPLTKELLSGIENKSGYIIHSANGKPYCPDNYNHRCHNVFMRDMHNFYAEQGIDIPMLSTHELRHTRASLWVNSNKNLYAIAAVMGWGDLKMLRKTYAHADIEHLKDELF